MNINFILTVKIEYSSFHLIARKCKRITLIESSHEHYSLCKISFTSTFTIIWNSESHFRILFIFILERGGKKLALELFPAEGKKEQEKEKEKQKPLGLLYRGRARTSASSSTECFGPNTVFILKYLLNM